MFNKYRGQHKNDRVSEIEEEFVILEEESIEGPVLEETPQGNFVRFKQETSFMANPDHDAQRQKEEEEWFRRFRGETLESSTDNDLIDGVTLSEEHDTLETLTDDGTTTPKEDLEPGDVSVTEELDAALERLDDVPVEQEEDLEELLPEETLLSEGANNVPDDEAEFVEELLNDLEHEEIVASEEKDEEKWSQELIADVEERIPEESETPAMPNEETFLEELDETLPESAEDTVEDEFTEESVEMKEQSDEQHDEKDEDPVTLTPVIFEKEEDVATHEESDWYRSTPFLRTAAILVLDMTEKESNEDEDFGL